MNSAIAIVGTACVDPSAGAPGELWENVLARRSAFCRLPPERLRLEDHLSADADLPACEIGRRGIQKQFFCQPANSKKPE